VAFALCSAISIRDSEGAYRNVRSHRNVDVQQQEDNQQQQQQEGNDSQQQQEDTQQQQQQEGNDSQQQQEDSQQQQQQEGNQQQQQQEGNQQQQQQQQEGNDSQQQQEDSQQQQETGNQQQQQQEGNNQQQQQQQQEGNNQQQQQQQQEGNDQQQQQQEGNDSQQQQQQEDDNQQQQQQQEDNDSQQQQQQEDDNQQQQQQQEGDNQQQQQQEDDDSQQQQQQEDDSQQQQQQEDDSQQQQQQENTDEFTFKSSDGVYFQAFINGQMPSDGANHYPKNLGKSPIETETAASTDNSYSFNKPEGVAETQTVVIHAYVATPDPDAWFSFTGGDIKSGKHWNCAKNWAEFWKGGMTMAANYDAASEKEDAADHIWLKNAGSAHHITCVWTKKACSRQSDAESTEPCDLVEQYPAGKSTAGLVPVTLDLTAGLPVKGKKPSYDKINLGTTPDLPMTNAEAVQNVMDEAESNHEKLAGEIAKNCAGPLCGGIYSGPIQLQF
jgi:chemotaxis protein histidine kinase CheA